MSLWGEAEEHRGQERVLCSLALASCATLATSLSLSFPICRMGRIEAPSTRGCEDEMREQTRSEAQHDAQHTVMCAVQVCRDGGDDDDGGRGSGSSGGEGGVEAGQVMAEAVIRESHGQISGSSASYCEEPQPSAWYRDQELVPGEVGETQIICFALRPLWVSWFQGQRGGERPRAGSGYHQSMPLCQGRSHIGISPPWGLCK